MERTGAAAVIVGNELLTAKIEDLNGPLLIRRLRECGIPLRRVLVVPDEVDAIVEAVCLARSCAAHVFTSGGIGPTHDDVTVRAVALALGRRIVRLPEMEALLRQHWRAPFPEAALRLADVPEGSELWHQDGLWYPVLTCDRVYMLPGVPQLFRVQVETVLARLEKRPIHLRCLYLAAGEPEIACALDAVAAGMPDVAIGSYPAVDRAAGYQVKLTVEHEQPGPAVEAVRRLVEALPQGCILKID
jgi:molybdenum cofactor synthesis domain-containing protein